MCPVAFRVTVLLALVVEDEAASGRWAEFPDPGEHDGQQVVAGWQPQRQAALVANKARWDAEQFVTLSGGVRATLCVDPGQPLEHTERFPASCAAHIHTLLTL